MRIPALLRSVQCLRVVSLLSGIMTKSCFSVQCLPQIFFHWRKQSEFLQIRSIWCFQEDDIAREEDAEAEEEYDIEKIRLKNIQDNAAFLQDLGLNQVRKNVLRNSSFLLKDCITLGQVITGFLRALLKVLNLKTGF